MMLRIIFFLLLINTAVLAQQKYPDTPDKIYGQLFIDVQLNKIFADSKTFPDCIPVISPSDILEKYEKEKTKAGFSLKDFVLKYFRTPLPPKKYASSSKNIEQHIKSLWQILKHSPDSAVKGSSLLPLPYPYLVPGGRFREVYYWDSYFTMLGLKESKEYSLMENMVNNFAYLINKTGHIPNGNRTYYLSRSQPPFFSLMVALLASVKGKNIYLKYHDALQKELLYWTNMQPNETDATYAARRIAVQKNGTQFLVSKYSDNVARPRQESYFEDFTIAKEASLEYRKVVRFADSNRLNRAVDSIEKHVWHNLRSAAASGWDFSSRWLMNGEQLYHTNIDNIIPVDLNCLLYNLDLTNKISSSGYNKNETGLFTETTKNNFRQLFFNEKIGWYCDADAEGNVLSNATLAGMYPLFLNLADKKDVPRIVEFLKNYFLKKGGVVTSLNVTGQQWDAPNGWAPLQWITIIGLENYGYHSLANEIAARWIKLNKNVFKATGKLLEKYNVIDINKPGGGGEYPTQDGFGWTNGVLLALMNKYKLN